MATTSWGRVRNMFVLTIGINNYQHCPKLSWAVADADAVESFFRDVLAVPSHRIMSLRDESATRADIIKAFHALREDDSLMIERDDPIVVYFAGHGCQWTSRQGLQARIQAICPQDVQVQDSPDRTVFPIPDYLLGSLINQLSSKKGNNITVIFDCCYAASGTRGFEDVQEGVRGVAFHGEIPLNMDAENMEGSRSQQTPLGFLDRHARSHVFLAACGSNEVAHETNGQGCFTRALLETLNKAGVGESSYIKFMRHMPHVNKQTPQCEGYFRDRILFSTQIPEMGTPCFQVVRCSNGRYEIKAGSIHGVTKDSLFDLFEKAVSKSQVNKPIGRLRVAKVYAFTSDAVLESGDGEAAIMVINPGFALQVRSGPECKLKVHFSEALLDKVQLVDVLKGALEYEVDHVAMEHADFGVDLKEGKAVFIAALDIVMEHGYQGMLPDTVEAEAGPISRVLMAACRWKHHLDTKPSRSLWRDQVHIDFFRLEQGDDDNFPLERNNSSRLNDGNNKVVITVTPDSDEFYGLEIRNDTRGRRDLFLLLVLFQISDLSIEILHQSSIGTQADGSADPSIPPNASLPIGWGTGGSPPFTYILPHNVKVDVAILKMYLTTRPLAESFRWLEQASPFKQPPPPIKSAEEVTARYQVMGDELRRRLRAHDEQWDTILFHVVQRSPEWSEPES